MTLDDVLVAQMGVELRPVRVGEAVVRTLGVVDLCVDVSARSRGLASRLLTSTGRWAWRFANRSPMC